MTPKVKPLIPHPALQIEMDSERILVVADLHIGWEMSLTEKGIHIPSQAWRIRDHLLKIVDLYRPDRLILLGDVKQTISRISLVEWRSVPEFFEALENVINDISVTLGNHDGDLGPLTPPSIKIIPSSGLIVEGARPIGLFHGHAWPTPNILASQLFVMGHIHPVVWFRDRLGLWSVRPVWIKARCDGNELAKAYIKHMNIRAKGNPKEILKRKVGVELEDPRLIIMPAFNDLIGGMSVNRIGRRLLGPLLNSGSVNLADAEVYLVDGTYLGTVKHLRTYINGNDANKEG